MIDQLVQTTKGLVPASALEIRMIEDEGDNHIGVAREWYLEGELVRRDAWVTILRGNDTNATEGKVG